MKSSSLLRIITLTGALSFGAASYSSAEPAPVDVTVATNVSGAGTITLPAGTQLTGFPSFPIGNLTLNGTFRMSDGTLGTYVETHTFTGGTFTTTIVYTLADGSATSTDTLVTSLSADLSRTVERSYRAFGATAAFTSTTTFPVVSTTTTKPNGTTNTRTGPSAYGTGAFTAADGTTGTLTTLQTGVSDGASITSTDYLSAAGLSRELRTEHLDGKRLNINVISVDPSGVSTTTTTNRIRVGHGHP